MSQPDLNLTDAEYDRWLRETSCWYCHARPIRGDLPCPGTGDGKHHRLPVGLSGFFVARDGGGDLAIWQERRGHEPMPALHQYESPALFDALAAALPHRDDTEAGESR